MAIRSAAKALIVNEGKILLNRCVHADGSVYYDLPGGGQRQFEAMEETVIREVQEETGYSVRILRFAALAEEIYTSKTLHEAYPDYTHRVKHIFLAELTGGKGKPTELDMGMERSEWMPVKDLAAIGELHPSALKEAIGDILANEQAVWLGTEYWHDTNP